MTVLVVIQKGMLIRLLPHSHGSPLWGHHHRSWSDSVWTWWCFSGLKGVNKEGSFLRMTRWHKALSLIPGHNGTSYFITRSTECLICRGWGSIQAIFTLALCIMVWYNERGIFPFDFVLTLVSLGLINYTKVIV